MANAQGFQGISIVTGKWSKPAEGFQGISIVTAWNGTSSVVRKKYKVKSRLRVTE